MKPRCRGWNKGVRCLRRASYAKGYCQLCYDRVRRHGDARKLRPWAAVKERAAQKKAEKEKGEP